MPQYDLPCLASEHNQSEHGERRHSVERPNERAFSGEPSERSERPERMRGRRVRCNAMLDGMLFPSDKLQRTGRCAAAPFEAAGQAVLAATLRVNYQDASEPGLGAQTYRNVVSYELTLDRP